MLLALDKYAALYLFTSVADANFLEAFDVKQDAIEFCDLHGQRYTPTFTREPKEWRFGPLGMVDVGRFKLVPEGDADLGVLKKFVERATHIDHSSVPGITTL